MSDKVDVAGTIKLEDQASPVVRKIQQGIGKITDTARKMGDGFKKFGNMGLMGGLAQNAHVAAIHMAKLGGSLLKVAGSVGALVGVAGFGGLAVEMQKYIQTADALEEASIMTGTNIEQLQDLRYAASLAGLSAEDLEGGMVKLNKALGDAARGKNKELASMFKRLGINLLDSNKQARSAGDVMGQLANAVMNNKNQIARNDIVMQAFGKTGAKWIAMLEGGQITLAELSEKMRQHGRISEEMAARAAKQADAQVDVAASIQGVFNVLYDKLLPILTPITEATSKWIDANKTAIIEGVSNAVSELATELGKLPWAEVLKGLREFGAMLKIGFDAIGGWNTVIPALALVLGGTLLAGIYAVTTAIVALNVAMLSNPFVLAAAAIGAAAYLIYSNWEPIAGFFTGMWQTVAGAFKTADGWIQSFIQDFTPQHLIDLWNAMPAYFAGLWADVKAMFPDGGGVGSWMADIGAALLAPLARIGSNLADGFGIMWENAKQPFNDFLGWLGGGFTALWQGAGNLLVGAWDWVAGGFATIWAGIRYPFDTAIAWVTDFVALFSPGALLDPWRTLDFSGIWDGAKSAFMGTLTWLNDFVARFVPGGLLGIWEGYVGILSGIWNGPRVAFEAAIGWLDSFVSRFVPGGLLGAWETVSQGFTGIWQTIRAPFDAALTWLDGFVAQFVPGGLAGIWQGYVTIFTGTWSAIKTTFDQAVTWLQGFTPQFLPTAIIEAWRALDFTAIWEAIKAPFIAAGTWLAGWVVQFIPQPLFDAWNKVTGFFTTLWNGVVKIFDDAWQKIQEIIGWIMGKIQPLLDAVRGVSNAVGFVGDKVKGAGGAVVEGVKNTAGAVADTGKKLVSGVREYLPEGWGGTPAAAPATSPVMMAAPVNPVQDAMRNNPPVAEIDGEVKTTVDIKLPPGVTATTSTESSGRVKPRTNVGTSMQPA